MAAESFNCGIGIERGSFRGNTHDFDKTKLKISGSNSSSKSQRYATRGHNNNWSTDMTSQFYLLSVQNSLLLQK